MTPGVVAYAHLRDVRAAARALPEDRAEPGALDVDLGRVLNFRAGRRIWPAGCLRAPTVWLRTAGCRTALLARRSPRFTRAWQE